jgi:hypothetical protein
MFSMSDSTSDATVLILRDIQARLGRLEQRVDEGFAEVRRDLREANARIDNMLAVFGGSYRDHDRRLSYVESRVDRIDPPPSPRRRR